MIGLVGAHRVGKTTLARAFAEKNGWKFAETSVSAIFKELGHDPREKFDFLTRLTIQEQILIRLNRFYAESNGTNVITDRTPIDMLGYLMAEAVGDAVTDEALARFKRYTLDCYASAKRHFNALLLVQPGIPVVPAEGKALPNLAYIEHLNALMMGLMQAEVLSVPTFYVPRDRLELEDRMECISFATGKVYHKTMIEAAEVGILNMH